MRKQWKQRLYFWAPKSLLMVTAAMKLKDAYSLQRYYFAKKVRLVKSMVFPVVMYGCDSWIMKKAEHQRIAAFEL